MERNIMEHLAHEEIRKQFLRTVSASMTFIGRFAYYDGLDVIDN